jgi:hypothetical protein
VEWIFSEDIGLRFSGNLESASGKQGVWWGASVRSVDRPSASSARRSATICYDALYGFNEADYNVLFLTDSLLESLESVMKRVRHMWRWASVIDPESRDYAEATISHPAVEIIRVDNNGVAASGTENNSCRSESKQHLVTNLFDRVRLFESHVLIVKTDMHSSL